VPNPAHNPIGDFGLTVSGELVQQPPFLTYSGISLLDSTFFQGIDPGIRPLRPIFDAAVKNRALHGIVFDGLWKDIGTPERLADVRTAFV
tara:strand:- start:6218 stop:6487 length:270 start_codon:yes stop_codon:yes gene_type:complete